MWTKSIHSLQSAKMFSFENTVFTPICRRIQRKYKDPHSIDSDDPYESFQGWPSNDSTDNSVVILKILKDFFFPNNAGKQVI